MKIACIIHSLDGGGAERVMASLATRLVMRQHAVTLITLDNGARERHSVDSGVARRHLDLMFQSRGLTAKLLNTRRRVKGLRAAILDEAPHVVLSFCDRTNILTLMAAKKLGIPVIISERSDPLRQGLGMMWEFLRDRNYRRATAMTALTESSARYLHARFGSPVTVIPSAVDVPPLESNRELAIRQRQIIGVGRLEHEKGFDRLIEAFAMVANKSPDWSLRILGEGSMRTSLEQRIGDYGLEKRVTLPGWIQPVWDELAASTMFALPSRYEGFPSALLEAMAVGVPCIAVDCEGSRTLIGDSNSGLLVPNDVAALADGIERLIEDDARREQLGASGKDVVKQFGFDSMVDAYEAILCRAADEKSA